MKSSLRFTFNMILILAGCLATQLVLLSDRVSANTTNQVIVRYADNCPLGGQTANYGTDVNAATKDTIPLEWWPASQLGVSSIPYSALQTAAVMIRSRIIAENLYYPDATFDYTSFNLDTRGSVNSTWNKTEYPDCAIATMDTVATAGNAYGNASSYQSNNAANSTSAYHIVNINSQANILVTFHAGANNVQWRATQCAEQSDDWKFCSINALAAELLPNNKWARRLNQEPSDKIRFETEAFFDRNASVTHAWLCQTDPDHWGYKNKCYMRSSPNNGIGYASNEGYITNSPRMNYWVAFPQTAGTTWYVWARGKGCGPSNDSIHIGLWEQRTFTAEDMTGWDSCTAGTNGFIWKRVRVDGSSAYITAATDNNNGAFKRLNLWMREDGMRVDRVILAQNAGYDPTNDAWANGY